MKKLFSVILVIGLLAVMVSCKKNEETNSSLQSETTLSQNISSTASGTGENTVISKNESAVSSQNTSLRNESSQTASGSSDSEYYRKIVDSETAWLASLQLDNGAIPMTAAQNGAVTVNPYFADFAAMALLDRADEYADMVKNYLDWHFSHLNTAQEDYNGVDGTIYDYKVTISNGAVTGETIAESKGKPSYDSTDSYAATFLIVLGKYYVKTGQKSYLCKKQSEIDRVVGAMLSTYDKGLTLSKPDYAVKYLMDNCEVYEGVCNAITLYEKVLTVGSTLERLKTVQMEMESAIEKNFWNASSGHYEAAIMQNGAIGYTFSWKSYYPCATAQLFPVSCGLIDPGSDRAKQLYQAFCNHYDWQNFKIPDNFYWGSNVYAAAVMGDAPSVKTYMTHYEKAMKKHAYPLYNADAAKVCMAANLMCLK